MKKFRKITVLVIMLMMALVLPFSVYANGPVPNPELNFYLRNLPEGTAYVDLAVCAPETEITELAQDLPEGLAGDCALIRGQYGECVSYSFRVRGAQSNIVPDENDCVTFAHAGSIPQWGTVRLVMANSSGEVIKVSEAFDIVPKGLFDYSLNHFEYDAAADSLQMDTEFSGVAVLLYLVISGAGLVLTCGVEWCVGKIFKLTEWFGRLILLTNVVSQLLMRILFVVLYPVIPHYALLMLLLEVLVYAGEFVVYRMKMYYINTKKCLFYVFAANTASLLLGLLLNLYLGG